MKATPRWEEEVFLFWLFLPKRERGFAAARSGQGRAVFWRGGAEPLDGEDRCDRIDQGGKDHGGVYFYSMEDNTEP